MKLIQKTSLRNETSALLQTWILEGRLLGGEPLRENKLCEELGISRTPLREALLGLERDGFVKSVTNKGFIVAQIDFDVIVELYPIVGNLEALALRLTGSELRKHCSQLKEINKKIERRNRSPEEMYQLDLDFHNILWKACPNKSLVQMLSKLKMHIRRFDGASERGIADIPNSFRQHAEIIRLIEEGKYTDAAVADEEHWRFGTNTVLEWLKKNKISEK